MLKSNQINLYYLILTVILLTISVSVAYVGKGYSSDKSLHKASNKIETEGTDLNNTLRDINFSKVNSLNSTDFLLFVIHQKEIIFWNNNKISPEFILNLTPDANYSITHNLTGWYLYSSKNTNDTTYFLLKQIKADYLVNNHFLNSNNNLYNCENLVLSKDKKQTGLNIFNTNEKFILNITSNTFTETSNNIKSLTIVLYVILLTLLLVLTFLNIHNFISKRKSYYFLITIISASLLVAINIYCPLLCFNFKWNYLVISSLLATALIVSTSDIKFKFRKNINLSPPVIIVISIFYFVSSWMIYKTISLYLLHTNDLSDLLDYPSITALTLIIIINISLFILTRHILNNTGKLNIPWFISIILILLTAMGYYFVIKFNIKLILISTLFIIIIFLLYELPGLYNRNKFFNYFFIILILSILTSTIFNLTSQKRINDIHKQIAETLAICNDEVLEKEILSVHNYIQQDSLLINDIFDSISTPEDDLNIAEYIINKYFSDLNYKYDIQITICRENELIEIQPEGDIYNCIDYFHSIVADYSLQAIDSILFNVKTNTESLYYIYQINFKKPQIPDDSAFVFVEFISSHIPEGLGYPELLIDSKANKLNLSGYSIANYSNSNLIYKFGDYDYTTTIPESFFLGRDNFIKENDYIHYTIKNSDGIYIIVSKPELAVSSRIFIFSITFFIFTFLSAFFYLILKFRKVRSLFYRSFSTRLQIFIIATLTLSFLILAFFTLLYIDQNNRQNIADQLNEKTNSVIIELQHKLNNINTLDQTNPEVLHNLLRKFSLVFFSDINLYNTEGILIATSRPEIFDKYLQSDLINRDAYEAIFNNNKLHFITNEKIGSLTYYSSYSPLILNSIEPAGIVNLPYFAKQSEINRSFFTMISYLINIYIIIGIAGTILAIIFSGYLIRPLRLLQQKMSKVSIDKTNEKFNWKRKDEIGALIHEYNKMVQKLEQSADLIKQNERESAWRENAQQIAHEIKNPLTPMRLNVQYLEKAYKNNDPDFESKLKDISNSLIKQIEVLNNVAEDFSNIAKARKRKTNKTDLRKVIEASVNTFDKRKNTKITTNFLPENEDFTIIAFEEDILRVFNNLIKNALQALVGVNNAKISILTIKDKKSIKVTVSDNGKGIPDDMKSKIFQPYFTTKSSGTGLGLAIVKTIINETGGKITFVSDKGKGTIFTLQFLIK